MEPILELITEVRLWVGLTPVQIDALPTDDGAQPPELGRFGMRWFPMDAINRAVMFESDDYHPKEFVAMQVFSCVIFKFPYFCSCWITLPISAFIIFGIMISAVMIFVC